MTVQQELLNLALRIDPTRQDTGAEFTLATIGVYDGDAFPKQRLLDILNSARRAMIPLIDDGYVVATGTLTFSAASGVATASKPTGYQDWISISGAEVLDSQFIDEVKSGSLDFVQSASVRYLFDINDKFYHYGTLIANAEVLAIVYKTLTDWTLANVTAGTQSETIPDIYHERLMAIAVAISKGMGDLEAAAFANDLIKGKAN